jgi:hypothetical protein
MPPPAADASSSSPPQTTSATTLLNAIKEEAETPSKMDEDESEEGSEETFTEVDPTGYTNIVFEDSHEFMDIDTRDIMPKSHFMDKSHMKLSEFFETIVTDLEHAQRIGIPLEEVKEEFHFVWDAIKKSHENLQDLLQKDVDMSIKLGDTMAKTRNLIRIAEDQPEVALRLGRRLETAWNLVDISEEEEKKNSEKLEELETDITLLNRNITAAANMEGRSE